MYFNPFDYNSFAKSYGDLQQPRQDDSPPPSPTNNNVPAHQEARTDPARLRGRDNSTIFAMPELRDALYGTTHQTDASGDEGRRIGRSNRIGQSTRMPERSNLRDGMFHSTRHDQVHIQRGDIPSSESPTQPPSPSGARRGIMSRIGAGLGKAFGLSRGGKEPSAASVQQSVISTESHINYYRQSRTSSHPEDEILIQQYINEGSSKEHTSAISSTASYLRRFSEWLKENNRPAIMGRLEEASLDDDAANFSLAINDPHIHAALNHLRIFSATGTVDIPARKRDIVSQDDKALIQNFEAALKQEQTDLRTIKAMKNRLSLFSRWLSANDKPAIANRLHDQSLDRDAREFMVNGDASILSTLAHLQEYLRTGVVNVKRRTIAPHDADIAPIADFRQAEAAASSEASAKQYRLALVHFSQWCRDNGKGAMVWRLDDEDLAADIIAFKTKFKKSSAAKNINAAMRRFRLHRQVAEANNALKLQPGEQGPGVEGVRPAGYASVGPSYQPQAPASHLTSLPSHFSGRDLEGYFDSTASQPQTPAWASHLTSLPSHFSGRDLEGYFDSTASQPQTPASSHLTSLPSHFSGRDLEGYFDSTASQAPTPFASTQDGLFEFTNNLLGAPYPYPGSAYAAASPAFDYDLNAPPPPEMEAPGGSLQAPHIVEEDYPSPHVETVAAAQRLPDGAWLSGDDIANFTRMLARQLRDRPNAGYVSFAEPEQAYYLARGERGGQVLRHLNAPIVFLPVNNDNRHWSLLVVNQDTRQAFHYDSMVSPDRLHLAVNTPQFHRAMRIANAMGVGTPNPMPIARQRDGYSCGDHVLTGIEELANRVVRGEVWQEGGMDLSMIRPTRDHIVDVLTRFERFGAE